MSDISTPLAFKILPKIFVPLSKPTIAPATPPPKAPATITFPAPFCFKIVFVVLGASIPIVPKVKTGVISFFPTAEDTPFTIDEDATLGKIPLVINVDVAKTDEPATAVDFKVVPITFKACFLSPRFILRLDFLTYLAPSKIPFVNVVLGCDNGALIMSNALATAPKISQLLFLGLLPPKKIVPIN